MQRLDWDDIRSFLAVARCGSLRLGAERAGSSAATLSRRLDDLERVVGTKLIERLPTGCRLTPAGDRVMLWAERMEAASFEILRTGDIEANDLVEGTVRINADEWVSFLLTGGIPDIRTRHPRLEVEILTSHRAFSLARREADIALRPLEAGGSGDDVTRRVGRLEFGLYGQADYVAAHGREIAAGNWSALRFVGFDEMRAGFAAEVWLRRLTGGTPPWLRCSYALAIFDGVKAGAGLGVLVRAVADRTEGLVPVIPEIAELAEDIWATTHAALVGSPRITATLAYVAELFARHPGADGAAMVSE